MNTMIKIVIVIKITAIIRVTIQVPSRPIRYSYVVDEIISFKNIHFHFQLYKILWYIYHIFLYLITSFFLLVIYLTIK